jgi:hypothetical protein
VNVQNLFSLYYKELDDEYRDREDRSY